MNSFFTKNDSKALELILDSKNRMVLPDPDDVAACHEVDYQRLKWLDFLKSRNNDFSEDWLWQNWRLENRSQFVVQKKILSIFSTKLKIQKKIKSLIRGGVPPEMRGTVWFACSGASEKMRNAKAEESYETMVKRSIELEGSLIAIDIEKDLLRTFPEIFQNDQNSPQINILRKLLLAYAVRNPEVGYCQSMNYICALILFHLPEEEAFWLFAALIEDILPPNYYSPSLIGSRIDQQVFQSCLAWKLPKLYSSFKKTGTYLEPIICPWLLCLYINVLPIYSVCRVWDCLFWEGNVVLFRIGLSMIKCKQAKLLRAKDFIAVYSILKSTGGKASHSFDMESPVDLEAIDGGRPVSMITYMINNAFGYRWLRSVPREQVQLLREKFEKLLNQENPSYLGNSILSPSPSSYHQQQPESSSGKNNKSVSFFHTSSSNATAGGNHSSSSSNSCSNNKGELESPPKHYSSNGFSFPLIQRVRNRNRKSDVILRVLGETDLSNLRELALQMDEGVGSAVELFAKEMGVESPPVSIKASSSTRTSVTTVNNSAMNWENNEMQRSAEAVDGKSDGNQLKSGEPLLIHNKTVIDEGEEEEEEEDGMDYLQWNLSARDEEDDDEDEDYQNDDGLLLAGVMVADMLKRVNI